MTNEWNSRKEILIRCIKSPFKWKSEVSVRSQTISDRENDPEAFIKRITPQIEEICRKGLPYSTPEEWDSSFKILGGGQSRRKSSAILSRMTWSQFIYYFEEISKNYRK